MDLEENLSQITEIWQFLDGTTEFYTFAGRGFSRKRCTGYRIFIKFSGFLEFFTFFLVKTSLNKGPINSG